MHIPSFFCDIQGKIPAFFRLINQIIPSFFVISLFFEEKWHILNAGI